MKVLRFLLVTMFMFTIFISPAQAKGGEEYGYVALLTQVDPVIPLRVQAQKAFERLLPQLLAAQKSGVILEFQPEFGAGIVKIKFSAGARPATLNGATVFDNIQAAANTVPHLLSAGQEKLALTYNPHFYISLYNSCFDASNLGAGSRIVASLRNGAGKIQSIYDGYADKTGHTQYACFHSYLNSVLPGYKVTFKVYTPAGVLRGTYLSPSTPSITITDLDKVNSIATGTGPAGKSYTATWYHPNLNAANTSLNVPKTGTISDAGMWLTDFGTTEFRGGDMVWIDVNYNTRFTFHQDINVPYAYCDLDKNHCGLFGFPNQTTTTTIIHAGTPYVFMGKSSLWGWYEVSLVDEAGLPVFLAAGDTFTSTDILEYTLPNLTASINYTTDVVSGTAPANKYFWVVVWKDNGGNSYDVWTHSTAAGTYLANFHSQVDLKTTDGLFGDVFYDDPITGNSTFLYQPFGP